MFLIIGLIVVFGSVVGAYSVHGSLAVLWQPLEFIIIFGALIGAYVIANPKHMLVGTAKAFGTAIKGAKYKQVHYLELLGALYAVFRLAKTKGDLALESHVEKPGVYEFPMGTALRRIIEAAGGVRGGKKLKAVIPGGVSTPVLAEQEIGLAMDFDGLRTAGSFLGAGGVVVLDESVNMAQVAHNIERFLAHESCGQCTPCREGSEWTVRILERILEGGGQKEDIKNLERIGENITGKVICALGDTVGLATRAFIKKFPQDFEIHG